MYFTAIINAFKTFKRIWWLFPIIGLGIYIWYLTSSINVLENTIRDKNDTILQQQAEIDYHCETIKNQEIKIEALKKLSKRKELIENKLNKENEKNKKIIEEYKKNTKNQKIIMKRIQELLPKKKKDGE